MSSINGPITRSEVIARAQNWVDRRVPYSQSAYTSDPDCGKTYRQDCSGYVSMCWHLDTSLTTATLPSRSTPISFAEVKAGDAVAYPGHVALAAGPPSGGSITIYQERSPGYTAQKITNPLSLYANAYRYRNITDDAPPTPPEPPLPKAKGEKDMIIFDPAGTTYILSGGTLFPVHNIDVIAELRYNGVPAGRVDAETWTHLAKHVVW